MPTDDEIKVLLSRPARYHLAVYLLEHGPVIREHDAIEDLGGRRVGTAVREELARFTELGMVKRAPTDEPRNYWERLDHPLWEFYEGARRALRSWDEHRNAASDTESKLEGKR